MSESKPPDDKLSEEFRNLGKSLTEALRAAWGSPERKKLQEDIESGLAELGNTLKKEAESFNTSPTGQRLKADVEDLRERIRSGEAEAKARQELLNALRIANTELKKVTARWATTSSAGTGAQDTSSTPTSKDGTEEAPSTPTREA